MPPHGWRFLRLTLWGPYLGCDSRAYGRDREVLIIRAGRSPK
jgi:hypothetical protein